jgi:2,4-dienoyl-CoA reductase-like NADH-dependent reductase (Old Yellow Enzyme family)
MKRNSKLIHLLGNPLELPCGVILKNRMAKSAMSDSLCDGEGNPSEAQIRLYEKWAEGGVALSLIGEVQGTFLFPENTGNLVLELGSNEKLLSLFSLRSSINGAHIWPQIGHAGALSHLPISKPKGPSALDIEGLQCEGMSIDEITNLPDMYARTALLAKDMGFGGIQIHAGHGFLLSQFLSPLFNNRKDAYGGSIESRCKIILEIIKKVRLAVGSLFPIAIRINSSDQLEGGLTQNDALEVIRLLDRTSIDLIDISGGTYFPGAKASSEGLSTGPYFIDFSRLAKKITNIPLMLTGGFKNKEQAIAALNSGAVDMIGLGRAMVLNPDLPNNWLSTTATDPEFPRFEAAPTGGITAWYTMRLAALGEDKEQEFDLDLESAIEEYNNRDIKRHIKWKKKFSSL